MGKEKREQMKNDSNLSFSRRNFLKKASALAATTYFAGKELFKPDFLSAAISVPKDVNIGIFGPSHCAAPFVYAKLKGFFKKEKINVNLINYPEMPLIAKDLISGKIDFGQLIVPLVFAIHTGSKPFTSKTPLVITQIGGTNGAALMVRKGSGIKAPADFKGKTIANHSKLSVHYLINMMFFEKQGLNFTSDMKFKVIELDEIANAMKNGDVDSFVMPEPKNALVENSKIGDIYLLSKYIWPNHPCCSLATRRDFYNDNRELSVDLTRVFTKSGLEANDAGARNELIDILRSSPDYKYDRVPRPALEIAFTPGRSDFYPFPFQSSARVIIEIMKKHDLLPADINDKQLAGEVFLSDLSRKIMKELGANLPKSNYRTEKILGEIKEYSM